MKSGHSSATQYGCDHRESAKVGEPAGVRWVERLGAGSTMFDSNDHVLKQKHSIVSLSNVDCEHSFPTRRFW